MNASTVFRKGAAVTVKTPEGKVELPFAPPPEAPIRGEAFMLAKRNMHKAWARRWMKMYTYGFIS